MLSLFTKSSVICPIEPDGTLSSPGIREYDPAFCMANPLNETFEIVELFSRIMEATAISAVRIIKQLSKERFEP